MVRRLSGATVGIATAVALATTSSPARANVDLEWRPQMSTASVGASVEIGLYAVSDDATDQSVGGVDAILLWDPAVLALAGLINNGSYGWVASWFPDDSPLDGLNDTWLDGDAFYQAVRRGAPGPPAFATPDGLLVTTIVFTAVGAASATQVGFLARGEQYSWTRVLDGFEPGRVVTGTLGSGSITILSCGSGADLDGDCDVDLTDLQRLAQCLGGPHGAALAPECQEADIDGDGHADLRDFGALQRTFTRP